MKNTSETRDKLKKIIYKFFKKEIYQNIRDSRKRKTIHAIELSELKKSKFLKLINHAKIYSPYYRTLLMNNNVNSIDDLINLPILTKTIIKKNIDYIKSTSEEDLKYIKKNSTSGSTGKASNFYSDKRDKREARVIRGDEFVPNFNFFDKQLIFWGAERDVISKKSLSYYFNKLIVKKQIVSTYHLTEQDINRNVDLINKFKPVTIVGYPSALHFMALQIQKNDNVKLSSYPEGIISAGETLQLHQKDIIEDVFKTRVYNRYGCREVGHIANECIEHNGYHYNADDLIIEVVDDKGDLCKDGIVGNLLITDLNNYAFPMIRYNIGDLGSISNLKNCSCGCTLPKLKTIEGRTFEIIHGTNGNKVSGTFWTLTFRNTVNGVEAFQIKQASNHNLHINVKTNESFSFKEEEKIKQIIREKLGEGIEIEIHKVGEFEYTKTGKFKWITSELSN